MSAKRTITDGFTALNLLAIEDTDVSPLGYQGFYRIALCRGNHQTALTLCLFSEGDRACGLCENRGFLGFSGLKEVGNPRKTTSNISCFGSFLRDSGDNIAYSNFPAIFHVENRITRHEVVGGYFAAG